MKDWVKENSKPDGSLYNLYTDGLKIYTSIDSRLQKHAACSKNPHEKVTKRLFSGWEKYKSKKAPFDKLCSLHK